MGMPGSQSPVPTRLGPEQSHETVITPNRARMKQLARLVVEPKTTFRLAPGHVHIMLFRLKLNGTPRSHHHVRDHGRRALAGLF